MVLYAETKRDFLKDVGNRVFIKKMTEIYEEKIGKVNPKEKLAWENSVCGFLAEVLSVPAIPDDIGVSVEYRIPGYSDRCDVILSGIGRDGRRVFIILELKQWTSVSKNDEEYGFVSVDYKGHTDTRIHPSYQALCYKCWISTGLGQEERTQADIYAYGYLHNYEKQPEDLICAQEFKRLIKAIPVYFKGEGQKLAWQISSLMDSGDQGKGILFLEENCRRPSLELTDMLSQRADLICHLSEEQMIVHNTIMRYANLSDQNAQKYVLIVNGGPGTGKSAVALYTLSRCRDKYKEKECYYLTKNAAPRQVYQKHLEQQDVRLFKRFFKDTGMFARKSENEPVFMSLVDECHRVTAETRGNTINEEARKNQLFNIIDYSQVSVFFIDEDQRVSLEDAGTIELIRDYCRIHNYNCFGTKEGQDKTLELKTQFRCEGSGAYLQWLDQLLGIRKPESEIPVCDYDVKVVDSFQDFRKEMQTLNTNNNARIAAGDCWLWKSRDDVQYGRQTDFFIEGVPCRWNNKLGIWALEKKSFELIGCIHTCQGLEFDYIGVIIGEDLQIRDGCIHTDYTKRASDDYTVNERARRNYMRRTGCSEEQVMKAVDRIIRNTYRVLLSRGMKGCRIYCVNPEMRQYFKGEIGRLKG